MSKQKAPRRVADNEALAVGTTIRGSAQKLNLVAALIRGKKVDQALNILNFTQKKGAVIVKKVLESAIANAEHNHEADIDELKVARIEVDAAPVAKRLTISLAGSTSSSGTGLPKRNSNRPRNVMCRFDWSLMSAAYSL